MTVDQAAAAMLTRALRAGITVTLEPVIREPGSSVDDLVITLIADRRGPAVSYHVVRKHQSIANAVASAGARFGLFTAKELQAFSLEGQVQG